MMKKLLVSLLCAIMLLCCVGAWAEEEAPALQTVGEFICEMNEDGRVYIRDYSLAEGQTELFIPVMLDGHRVENFSLDTMPESVETLYVYNECYPIGEGWDGMKLVIIRYYDYDMVQDDDWYSKHLTDMGEDDYALGWASTYTNKNGKTREGDASDVFYAEELPTELGGHKVHIQLLNNSNVIYTSGEWQYNLVTYDNDFRAELVAYVAGEEITELVIPNQIDGYTVTSIPLAGIPASVELIYKDEDVYITSNGEERKLTVVAYNDYAGIQQNEWRSKLVPDMTENDLALTNVQAYTYTSNGSKSATIKVYAADMPTELLGKKCLNAIETSNLWYVSGEWTYVLSSSSNGYRAEIVSSTVAEGLTELVIPDQIDGYTVSRIALAAIPASVELVYRDEDSYITNDQAERTLKVIAYDGYEDIQADEWVRERVPDMTENDLALTSVHIYTYTSSGSNSEYASVYADDLPAELLGKRCLVGIYHDYVWYTSGQWVYAYYNTEKTSVAIEDVTDLEGQTTLLVPYAIDGLPVQQVSPDLASTRGVSLFVIPRNTWMSYSESKPTYDVLYYIDRAWVEGKQDDYYTERYAWLGEKELSLEDYTHYAGGDSTKDTIDYKDIPTEVDGYKLTFNMYFDGNVTVYKKDDYSYILLTDDTIAVTKYDNELTKSLIIPARIDGKTVTALMGDKSNYVINSSELTSLELPSTLKVLGKRAIYAWYLKKLEIPDGVTEIGEEAIRSYKLSSLTLPEGLTTLGTKWLYSGSLKSISFPATLTTLADNAFSDADRLDSVKLPETVTNVGKGAFSDISRLSKLTLPENMTEIPESLASGSERLTKITIPAATEVIGKRAFAGCSRLATVTFAKKDAQIKVIGEGAFASSALSKIALPESVTTIGKEAFMSCDKLATVTMYDNITTIERYAFSGCTKLTKISLSEGLTTIAEGTFMGCKKLASVTIPASVTAIEDFAFEGCSSKLTITTPEGSFAQQWAEANGYKVKIAK